MKRSFLFIYLCFHLSHSSGREKDKSQVDPGLILQTAFEKMHTGYNGSIKIIPIEESIFIPPTYFIPPNYLV
ncbi:hypothetical protein QNI16_33965 [Cytophagaceae bacterium YF14B1]|uniref:Uncharacterized protein n=1 Tax=Xanthocytophaga flava TaxID=3048013 RepID=A0AAE3QYG3_9BACT|nr:hypothetical protein [Xanthocytophaga flavus]MDJ1485546.1 hypothetical protein [Xanthocytophaga flavus]